MRSVFRCSHEAQKAVERLGRGEKRKEEEEEEEEKKKVALGTKYLYRMFSEELRKGWWLVCYYVCDIFFFIDFLIFFGFSCSDESRFSRQIFGGAYRYVSLVRPKMSRCLPVLVDGNALLFSRVI